MRPHGRRVLRFATPLKLVVQRFAFVLLVGAALSLIVLDRAEPKLTERLRVAVTDFAAPLLEFAARPAASIAAVSERVEQFLAVYTENEALRAENERLKEWQAAVLELNDENRALRAMLNVVADPRASFISARVIGDGGGAFVRTVLINAGTRDGVATGQAVVNGDGLIGRIVEAGERTARVLLLTDLNSRIPVVVESSRERAILSGDNSDSPKLAYLADDATVAPGDRIVTSGHGGMFPPGLLVGRVTAVDGDRVRVAPFADWRKLEFVSVLNYVVPGVLPETRRADRFETWP